MKKIVLFAFLTIGFVNYVFAEDDTSTTIICEKDRFYNGDEETLKENLSTYNPVNCDYSDDIPITCTCPKCPGSGVTKEESTCVDSSCKLNKLSDCTLALDRQDRTGSFKYDVSACTYSPKTTSTATSVASNITYDSSTGMWTGVSRGGAADKYTTTTSAQQFPGTTSTGGVRLR